jgi:hypothetical protein
VVKNVIPGVGDTSVIPLDQLLQLINIFSLALVEPVPCFVATQSLTHSGSYGFALGNPLPCPLFFSFVPVNRTLLFGYRLALTFDVWVPSSNPNRINTKPL